MIENGQVHGEQESPHHRVEEEVHQLSDVNWFDLFHILISVSLEIDGRDAICAIFRVTNYYQIKKWLMESAMVCIHCDMWCCITHWVIGNVLYEGYIKRIISLFRGRVKWALNISNCKLLLLRVSIYILFIIFSMKEIFLAIPILKTEWIGFVVINSMFFSD